MTKEIKNDCLWINVSQLEIEMKQLEDEGRDTSRLADKLQKFISLGNDELWKPERRQQTERLLEEAQQLPMRRDYRYNEPSDLESIKKLRLRGPRKYKKPLPDKILGDRVTGAWLGRCIGCLLGKPIEGIRSPELWDFLKLSKQYPLQHYIKFGVRGKAKEKYPHLEQRKWIDKIDHMPIDDDTNYTTTGVLIVKKYGGDFTPADVGQFWLENIPLMATCTAERIAYRNMAHHIQPPESAVVYNAFREMIGAQIRADGFGYVNMGNPQRAAEFAWRDASISHIKNGIYGEMFMAAMIAAAPYCDSIEELVKVGLSEIPKTSRLAEDIQMVLGWHKSGFTYDAAVVKVQERWDERHVYNWLHTNSNAAICTVGLLWGDGDFGKSICRAVQLCFDTDCNGATVGSIMGMMLGTEGIGPEWSGRVNNTLKTSLMGYDTVKITEIAEETFGLYKAIG